MKKFLLILPVALLMMAGCNSSYTTQSTSHQNQPTQQAQTTSTPTQQPIVQTSTSTSINSSVSTYTDNTWGFSFQYPKNYVALTQNVKKTTKGTATLVIVHDTKDKSTEFGPELDVEVIQQPYAANGKIYTDVYSFAAVYFQIGQYDNRVKTKIDGYDAFQTDKPTAADSPINSGKDYMVMKNGLVYHISYYPKDYPGFQDIVNSFKFIK